MTVAGTGPSLPMSVIVLNYNGLRWIANCLDALIEGNPGAEVIVVDNASTDGSADIVRSRFPDVRLLQLPENVGFAAGNNAGARAASGQLLVFLNNDTVPERGFAGKLRTAFDDPSVGLATARIVYLHDPTVIDSAGDGYLRAGGAYKRFHGQPATGDALAPDEVFGACGAAFTIRRDLFEELGGFDEAFFMVYEDVDLSYRARLLGWRCVYVADAVVHHGGSSTLGRVSPSAVFYGQRNLEWVYVKNTPGALLARTCAAHVCYVAAAGLRYLAHGRGPAYFRAKFAALGGLPRVLRQRREIQHRRRADTGALWRVMDPGWISVKTREKRFDLGGPA